MKNKFRKTLALVITAVVLLTSVFTAGIVVNAENSYHVALINVNDRKSGDGKGDDWNDYIVENSMSPEIITAEKMSDFSNNEAFVVYANRTTANMIFSFDAGEGKVFKNPSVSWCGRAVTDAGNYVKVYVGYDLAREDWELIGEIGQDKTLFPSSNNYSNPSITDLNSLVGSGYRKFYVKVEMYNAKKTHATYTSFSNLTVDAVIENGETVVSNPNAVYLDGISETGIEMNALENISFVAKALPFSLTDRSLTVTAEDSNILDVTETNGVFTITGKLKGETKLKIKSNIGNYEKLIDVSVNGTQYTYSDSYPIYTTTENGNVSGNPSTFTAVNGKSYGPKGYTGDYIVLRDVDFKAFGTLGASSVKMITALDGTSPTSAFWDVYADSIDDANLLATLVSSPYGSLDGDTEEIYSGLSRPLTGKHDIYVVLRNDAARLFDVAFANFSADYSSNLSVIFDDNDDTEFMRHIVATRNIDKLDGTKLFPKASAKPGEIVFRVDAEPGKKLDTLGLEASVRNIHSGEVDYGKIVVSVSTDRNIWYNQKIITDKLDNAQNPANLNLNLDLTPYAKTQESIYVKFSVTRANKAQKTWTMISAVNLNAKSDKAPASSEVTDIAVSTNPQAVWYDNYGAITIKEGTEATLTATALPLNATDTSLTVTSSDGATVTPQKNGDGKWTLVAFEAGSAMITVKSKSGVTKNISITVEEAPKIKNLLLSVNPQRNPDAEIVDDGVLHPINQVPCSWTGEEFGLGNTTGGDFVKFKDVDLSVFGDSGPFSCYIMASNYSGETTNKTWSLYIDSIEDENRIAFFTVRPINGWNYQQMAVSKFDKAITGTHDLYLVCEIGGSVWSLTFTDDKDIGKVNYELPFITNFDTNDTLWIDKVIDMNGVNFSGSLTATSAGTNYDFNNPVTDESKLVVNGSMTFRFDAPEGEILNNAVLKYSGRSITSPTTDEACILPGSIIFYVSSDGEHFNKISEMKRDNGNFTVDLSAANGLKTFYLKIDIIRTSSIASWTRLTALSVTADLTSKDAKLIKIDPEPSGATLPATFDFSNNSWKNSVYEKSTGIATQQAIDPLNRQVSALHPTSARKYEGVVFKVIPESGKLIDNLCVSLNGRAVGGSTLSVYVSADGDNYEELFVLSQSTVTDDNYDQINAGVKKFDQPTSKAFVKVVFYSMGNSFIDYASMLGLNVSMNNINGNESNIPFTTAFSSSKTQINSWLRHVYSMDHMYVKRTSSDTIMYPVAGKHGTLVMKFNSESDCFSKLYASLRCKSVSNGNISINVSNNGKDYTEIASLNEQTDEYASSNTYMHDFDISKYASSSKNIWIKFVMQSSGGEGTCTLNSLLVSTSAPYVAPETLEDKWLDYIFDTSMFDDGTGIKYSEDLSEQDLDEFDASDDEEENTATVKKKRVKRKVLLDSEVEESSPIWIIIGIVAGTLVVAGAVVMIILFKKKKRKIKI